jgi:hypothetical protein
MNLDNPSTRRFCAYALMVVAMVGLLCWFIPAVTNADQKAPVHTDAGFHSQCMEDPAPPPEYGNREPDSYCES